MEFDRYAITLWQMRPDAPTLDEAAANALQDAHLAHNAEQRDAGHLLAAGPIGDERFRGLSIWNLDADRARALSEANPSVRAGRHAVTVLPWMVVAGTMTFSPCGPRSQAEAEALEFDRFTLGLLTLRPDGPDLDEAAAAALQDAHMAGNADAHDAGHLLVAGPVAGDRLRGLGIWTLDPDRVRALSAENASVRAGRHAVTALPWMVPAGTIAFFPTRFPRSMAEAAG